jgi:hypothetical protein
LELTANAMLDGTLTPEQWEYVYGNFESYMSAGRATLVSELTDMLGSGMPEETVNMFMVRYVLTHPTQFWFELKDWEKELVDNNDKN